MDWNKPGFGWTVDKKEVKLLNEGIPVTNEFPGDAPYQLIKGLNVEGLDIDKDYLNTAILEVLTTYFTTDSSISSDLLDFQSNYTSNGRVLKWQLMYIPANMSFKLHAHPNIEVILVLRGAIHEYRMKNKPFQKIYETNDGPSLLERPEVDFLYRSCSATSFPTLKNNPKDPQDGYAGFLINEIGSIHLSFTREEETLLLVLWSGGHANIPIEQYPPREKEDMFPLIYNNNTADGDGSSSSMNS